MKHRAFASQAELERCVQSAVDRERKTPYVSPFPQQRRTPTPEQVEQCRRDVGAFERKPSNWQPGPYLAGMGGV